MGKLIPVFDEPKNTRTKIWRYLDLTKFLSLIDKGALFFSRLDKLEDHFEGSFPKGNIEQRPPFYEKHFQKNADFFLSMHSVAHKEIRKFFLVNCWCLSEYEIAAMWKLYVKSDEGVAIQSTYERFKNCFGDNLNDVIYLGDVKYIDFNKESFDEGNFFSRFFHKRQSFGFENEFRALIFRVKEGAQKGLFDIKTPVYEEGKYIQVDLNVLIEKIFVSPSAPLWFVDLVKSIIKKYGIAKDIVIQSNLQDDPVY